MISYEEYNKSYSDMINNELIVPDGEMSFILSHIDIAINKSMPQYIEFELNGEKLHEVPELIKILEKYHKLEVWKQLKLAIVNLGYSCSVSSVYVPSNPTGISIPDLSNEKGNSINFLKYDTKIIKFAININSPRKTKSKDLK